MKKSVTLSLIQPHLFQNPSLHAFPKDGKMCHTNSPPEKAVSPSRMQEMPATSKERVSFIFIEIHLAQERSLFQYYTT